MRIQVVKHQLHNQFQTVSPVSFLLEVLQHVNSVSLDNIALLKEVLLVKIVLRVRQLLPSVAHPFQTVNNVYLECSALEVQHVLLVGLAVTRLREVVKHL
tara:strand:- start:110 stop:409 length:300 start_codon:yes stop_codon:yes gene_type:complete